MVMATRHNSGRHRIVEKLVWNDFRVGLKLSRVSCRRAIYMSVLVAACNQLQRYILLESWKLVVLSVEPFLCMNQYSTGYDITVIAIECHCTA